MEEDPTVKRSPTKALSDRSARAARARTQTSERALDIAA